MQTSTITAEVHKRQLWALPTPTTTALTALCKTLTLPAGGSLVVNNSTISFNSNVIYQPACTGSPADGAFGNVTQTIDGYRDPFYASVTPLVYVVGLTTVIAWFILVVLLLLPRSYNSLDSNQLARAWRRGDGIKSLLASQSSPFPIGNRPWLQRFAALMVVMALTAVSTDTFRAAREQYDAGYSDATKLKNEVTGSIEVRVIRVICDLFLWLAQIQTLIRLFPRRKEKLVIKWVGFILILLDIIFSCLNSFFVDTTIYDTRPRSYRDAIPALSYLFQLALNLLYAAWVGYYAMTKRTYAFYHVLMPEICIVAFFASLSLLIPVVFFLVDILESDVSAWGDYFRWVGSAAASIVVWEWVERIELLEREEKKDGILGREIFEEDDVDGFSTPGMSRRGSHTGTERWRHLDRPWRGISKGQGKVGTAMRKVRDADIFQGGRADNVLTNVTLFNRRKRRKSQRPGDDLSKNITIPPPALSQVDRTEATSPGSTVYTIRYHTASRTPPALATNIPLEDDEANEKGDEKLTSPEATAQAYEQPRKTLSGTSQSQQVPVLTWAANVFRRSRRSPPVEVKNALSMSGASNKANMTAQRGGVIRWLDNMTSKRATPTSERDPAVRPPTVIPPPTRGTQPWTPDQMRRAPVRDTAEQPSDAPVTDANTTMPDVADSQRPSTGVDLLEGTTAKEYPASNEQSRITCE